ncbi:MAG: chloramphenicol acetyltransferase [Acidobacteria bacterium]|nr:chloramphenicol acetyltransferase [Acidobacteriota bacterium]
MSRTLSEEPSIDASAEIGPDVTLGAWTAVGARTHLAEMSMGDYSYIVNDSSVIYAEIGKFCSIASQVRLNPGNHPMDRAAMHHFSYRCASYQLADADDAEFFEWRRRHRVTLGHDVWIGHGATVMPGVSIGTGAAVGSGAVVTKDVAPFEIVGGVPARRIRMRFDEALAADLLALAWWDWPRELLRERLADFQRLSARQFVDKYTS